MKKIQIALVSKETLPVFYMINELLPDEVYLIGTDQTNDYEARIAKAVESITEKHVVCHRLKTDANDIRDCMRQCDSVHAKNGDDCEYCYNLTCGTKLMAIGALVCAQKHKAAAVYADYQSYTDFDEFHSHPMTRLLDIDTIMTLQGQKIKEKVAYAYDAERTECAESVRQFIEDKPKAYSVLISYYNRYKQLPNPFSSGKLHYYREGGKLAVEYDDAEVFSSRYRDAFKMLFEGRWWETLVADAVARWADGRHEVFTSVRFEPQNGKSTNDKNEIDVLVNMGTTLLFVECKSGSFDQNNIYKLQTICNTYGSYKSKGVIISYRRNVLKPDLEEKARENRVQLLIPNKSMGNIPRELDKIIKSSKA